MKYVQDACNGCLRSWVDTLQLVHIWNTIILPKLQADLGTTLRAVFVDVFMTITLDDVIDSLMQKKLMREQNDVSQQLQAIKNPNSNINNEVRRIAIRIIDQLIDVK